MSEYHQHLDMIECKIDDGSFRHLPPGRILIRTLTGVGTDGRTLLAINIAEADHDVEDPSTEVCSSCLRPAGCSRRCRIALRKPEPPWGFPTPF